MTQESMKFIGGMLVAALVGGGLSSAIFPDRVRAQGRQTIVTAEQVNLVNRAGRIRGILSAEDERGAASLTLFDETGQPRSALTVGRDGTPALQIYDRTQVARVVVTIENDQPAIVINGEAGDRAILSTPAGGPTLAFGNRERIRAEVGINRAGAPRLGMFGPTGQPQLSLNISERGEPVVTLRDEAGRSRASLGVVAGATVINLADQQSARVVLGVATDGSASLSFLDAAGKITERVPK